METTASVCLIYFIIYVAQAEATCSFVILPLSGGELERAHVGFFTSFYSAPIVMCQAA